jgi:glycosyltransferase involved in cell wall biosynthesis
MKVSVIILTFNSEAILEATLSAAARVSDDIHIVDSLSTDRTLEIAKSYGTSVVQRPFVNYGEQRNWAIENLPSKYDWQLHLDADERPSDDLITEINMIDPASAATVSGYFITRLTYFLGRPIRHGGLFPNWHMRLFRQGAGRCESRLYDQHFYVDGLTQRLNHPMIDDQRNTIAEWVARHNRWAQAEVAEILRLGQPREGVIQGRISGNPIERKRALRGFYYRNPALLRALLLFLYRYFLRFGFLDGKEGLIYFVLQTFWFRFLVDSMIFEREKINEGRSNSSVTR